MLTALLALALVGAPQDSAHVVVVATTDVRGEALGWDYLADASVPGGLARVATIVDSLRARYPGRVVAVDAGDALSGGLFATYAGRVVPRDPHPVVEALNVAGYDAATLGDHDFELGMPAVRRAVAGAAFPYVAANLIAVDGDTSLYPSFVVLRRAGLRIAVTGFVAPETMIPGAARLGSAFRIAPIADVAAPALDATRRQADLVIALVYGGMERVAATRATRAALTSGRARPDLVIAGYAGREIADSVVSRVPVVQPRPGTEEVAVMHLWLVREGGAWRTARYTIERVTTDGVVPAVRVSARLAATHAATRAWAQAPIGRALTAFSANGARAGASALMDFINRVQRERAGAELAATPAYTASAGLPRGTIRRADVLAVYPHDYRLLAVRISGAQLKEYLEHAARYFHVDAVGRVALDDNVPGADFDVVGGAQYAIDLRAPVGARIRGLVVRGRPVQPADSFTMAINDRRRAGAGGYTMVATAPVVYDRGEYVRDLLVEEIERRETLDSAAYLERGWRIVPGPLASAVRVLFRLPDDTPPPPSSPQDRTVLRVLAVGDLRGRFDAVPKLKAMMDSVTRACGCPTLRLATGDAISSGVATPVAGRASTELLGRAGVAAAALGERELSLARDTLLRRMAESGFPWLAANIFDSATGRRPEWSEPYRVLAVGERRVAVIGYIGEAAAELVSAGGAEGLRFADGVLALKAALDASRAARPDLTVLLAHAGADEIERLATALPRGSVDLVVAGHGSDDVADGRIGGIPAVWAGAEGVSLAIADLVTTASGGREIRPWTAPVPADARPDAVLAPFAERFARQRDSAIARPVAALKLPLDRGRPWLGQVVAEARRNALRADLGLVRADELRAGLSAGPVAHRELLQVQPLGRTLVLATIRGVDLLAMFERVLRGERPSAYVAGAEVRYDAKRPAGRRVRRVLFADGRELQRDREYRIAVDDADEELTAGRRSVRSGVLDVDALSLYLRRLSQPVEISDRPGFIPIGP
jgi:2',3'-cyclic-nucleotide 2'-phosphodiesterase (5'-nucleotidase family)